MEAIDISKINTIRKSKGITIKKLVELSGISYTTLSKVCAGYVVRPNKKTLDAIAKALDVPVSTFFKDNDPYNSSLNWLEMLPQDTANAIIKFFALNPSSKELSKALFSETPDKVSVSELNNRIVLFNSIQQIKDLDTAKILSSAIDIIINNQSILDVIIACANQSESNLKKIASAIPYLYASDSDESENPEGQS